MQISNIKNLKKISLVAAFAISSAFVFNGCAAVMVGGAAAGAGAYIGSDSRTVDKQVDDQKISKNVLSILRNDATRSDYKVFRVDCVVVMYFLLVKLRIENIFLNVLKRSSMLRMLEESLTV